MSCKLMCPVRFLEFICCCACLGLIIYLVSYTWKLFWTILVLSAATSIAFTIITWVDLVATCSTTTRTTQWNSWLMFSMSAAILFFLCAGLLIVQFHRAAIIINIITGVIFGFTAIIFLLDCIFTMCLLVKRPTDVKPEEQTKEKIPSDDEKQVDEYTYTELMLSENNLKAGDNEPLTSKGRFTCTKATCLNRNCPKKRPKPITYGGTFHVSKDVAPLPSPPTDKRINSAPLEKRIYSSPPEKKMSYDNETQTARHCTIGVTQICTCPRKCCPCPTQNKGAADAETNDLYSTSTRTVSVTTKSIPLELDESSPVQDYKRYFCSRCGCSHKIPIGVGPPVESNELSSYRQSNNQWRYTSDKGQCWCLTKDNQGQLYYALGQLDIIQSPKSEPLPVIKETTSPHSSNVVSNSSSIFNNECELDNWKTSYDVDFNCYCKKILLKDVKNAQIKNNSLSDEQNSSQRCGCDYEDEVTRDFNTDEQPGQPDNRTQNNETRTITADELQYYQAIGVTDGKHENRTPEEVKLESTNPTGEGSSKQKSRYCKNKNACSIQ